MTQIYIKQNIYKHRTQNFQRISPFGITPVEKAHKVCVCVESKLQESDGAIYQLSELLKTG